MVRPEESETTDARISARGSGETGRTPGTRRFLTPEQKLSLLQAGLIVYVFVRFARVNLRASFTDDDMANLYKAWEIPILRLIELNVLFWVRAIGP
jgi:hypothetical protein